MNKGDSFKNIRISQVIYLSSILVPTLLIMYGLLVMNGFAPKNVIYSTAGALVSLGGLALTMLISVFLQRKPKYYKYLVFLFSAIGILYSLSISGFLNHLSVSWIVLSIGAYLLWGNRGFSISLVAVYLAAFLNIFANGLEMAPSILSIFLAILISVASGLIIEISRIQKVDLEELHDAKNSELLQTSRISAIMNNITDAVISTDSNGIIQVYNSAALGLIDTNKDLKGQTVDEVFKLRSIDDNKRVRLGGPAAKNPGFIHRDDLYYKIGSQSVRLEVDRSVLKSKDHTRHSHRNKVLGYVLVIRDITRAKSVEEEKDEFISVVSHELRTPLTIAEGNISNVSVLLERGDTVSPKLLQSSIKESHEQIIFLSRMVNDLSTLSRAERGVADTPERINVNEMVHDLYNDYLKRAEHAGLKLDLDADPQLGYVTVSRLYLKELLQNFITNAIKYTKEGGVTIIAKNHGDSIYLAVKDTGIGISKSDQEKIFDKFFRSEDYRTRETRGTGLGLYVCTKLAKKLNTSVELKSRLNHGSTFSFNLNKEAEK